VNALLLANLAATLLLTGIAWSLQFVQLPLLRVDDAEPHRRRNSALVAPIMAVETVTAALLLRDPSMPIVTAFVLWIGVAIGTAGYTLAHSRNRPGLLPRWNLVRALCWTARSAILLSICAGARFS
jgi:hypothetical protein